jgi:hypothetical protein
VAKPVKPQLLTPIQDRFVRMEAAGLTTQEIISELFNFEPSDPRYHSAECKLSRWRKHPMYEETWKDEVRKLSFPIMAESLKTLKKQMRTNEPWLVNKASNDLLTFTQKQIFGGDEKQLTVQIQGMPDLGTPDDAEPEE